MQVPGNPGGAPGDGTEWLGRTILERFKIERILGHGGMGEVLLAHDTLLNRRVALKRWRSDDALGSEGRRALLREARRASQVTDPRIAAIYDVLDLGDDVLIVMEYVTGTTLRERMSRPVELEEFWDLSTQCVEAVAAAHAHGVIHRDIKPENLMVTGDHRVKILDFGIARRAEASGSGTAAVTTTTTTMSDSDARTISGTPQYMSPEAHYGGSIDERTDIFSLGVVFYELLTSRNPFAAPNYKGVLERIMNVAPQPVSELNPSVERPVSDVIARMMARSPAERYASCAEVTSDLARARHGDPVGSPAPVAPQGRTARGMHRSLIVPGVAVLALGIWLASRVPYFLPLPASRNLAVLAPATPGANEEFAAQALGSIDLLSARLQKHQDRPGFQLAPFQEGVDENARSPGDARRILGANLALVPTLEQRSNVLRARLELWDTARGWRLRSRAIEVPLSRPFEFQDRLYHDAAGMLGLDPSAGTAASAFGVRGAGTLRFLLQGVGRACAPNTEANARRAAGDFELACQTEPEAAAPHAWLALAQRKCYQANNDTAWLARAEISAGEAIRLDGTRVEGHWALALVHAARKRPAASLTELESVCSLEPTNDEAYHQLGRTRRRLGQPDGERATYLAVIAQRPDCWQPWWWLATWQFAEGHVDEAIRAYREMIGRSPDLYRGYQSLGGLLTLNGDYGQAIDTLKIALALRPTRIAFDNLGTAYFNSGMLEAAVDAYNQSFQFGLADYQSWLNLGDAYYWLRARRDQATQAYAQAVRLGREEASTRAHAGRTLDVMIPANLATVFPKLGQPDSARAYLQQALSADSTNSMVQYCAALTYWGLGSKGEAVGWLGKAVRGGYPVAWLRDSPVFRDWHEEEGFRALIASADPEPQPAASSSQGGSR